MFFIQILIFLLLPRYSYALDVTSTESGLFLGGSSCKELREEVVALSNWTLARGESPASFEINCTLEPEIRKIEISKLIPESARISYGTSSYYPGPNCFHTAFSDLKIVNGPRYVDPLELKILLTQSCEKRGFSQVQAGDLGVIWTLDDGRKIPEHTFIRLGNLVFHKGDGYPDSTRQFELLREVIPQYVSETRQECFSNTPPEDCKNWVEYYKCNKKAPFVSPKLLELESQVIQQTINPQVLPSDIRKMQSTVFSLQFSKQHSSYESAFLQSLSGQIEQFSFELEYQKIDESKPLSLIRGIATSAKSFGERSALTIAANRNDIKKLELILKSGVHPDWIHPQEDFPALIMAAEKNHLQAARVLLEAGADPDTEFSESGNTLLIWAASHGKYDLVDLLLEYKADPRKTNQARLNALLAAVDGGHKKTASLLATRGKNIDYADPVSGLTALQIAVRNKDFKMTCNLLELGARADQVPQGGWTNEELAVIEDCGFEPVRSQEEMMNAPKPSLFQRLIGLLNLEG